MEEGHDVAELMERAGAAVAREVLQRFPDARRVAVVCGGGSNGGDGRIAARILREEGRDAVETTAVEQADVIVDALFGTGFHGEPREEAAATIERINAAGAPVVAIDVPSGVDASTGEIATAAVRAAVTVTFHGRKLGLAVAPGLFHAGEVVVADIGLEQTETENRLATAAILTLVPRKRSEDSKYSAGSVLVVGGAPGMTGAACLAAEAAFRADAGYVAVAVPEPSLPVVETKLLEPVKLTWAGAREAAEKAARARDRPRPRPRSRREGDSRRADRGRRAGARARRRRAARAGARRLGRESRPDAPRGRARAPARRGLRLGRCTQARSGAAMRRAVRLRLPAQGRGHDRRRTGTGRARRARARLPASPPPAPATSSPASSRRSSPRGSSPASPQRPRRRLTASPPGASRSAA